MDGDARQARSFSSKVISYEMDALQNAVATLTWYSLPESWKVDFSSRLKTTPSSTRKGKQRKNLLL